MNKFKLAIGLHNHQPVGNFDSVFEEAHNQAYLPFLRVLEKFPRIRLSLHQSGILWNWQEKKHPEYFELVRKLIAAGQIELMTGGFYEPILPSIPDRDKLGQIALLNDYLKAKFGARCAGLWLAERVWEPHLPKILNQTGVEYLPIDDTHFLYAGLELDDLKGVFITEEEGAMVKVLPIQKKLRYLIPFGTVEKVIDELKYRSDKNAGGLAIYADDGEKFGVWPHTNEHCYGDGWLEDFFAALCENSDWLEVCTLGEAAMTEPVGRIYLPTAAYTEMLHWSLPAKAFTGYEEIENLLKETGQLEKYGRYIRGGHWRGFLTKYEEANFMHKRMLLVSNQLNDYMVKNPQDTETIKRAKHYLYAGQCNCPYWHGVFGGLYLPHLRTAIYENLIQAEKLLKSNKAAVILQTEIDYDCDGHPEVIVSTDKFWAAFKPSSGGMLVELDNYECNFNLCDTLRRRQEGYHWKLSQAQLDNGKIDKTASIHDVVLTKEVGLEKLLVDDWYLRRCFIDHFLPPETDIDRFLTGHFGEQGDFVLGAYEYRPDKERGTIILRRKGHLWRSDGVKAVTIEKRFYFAGNSEVISVNYSLTADDEDIYNVRLGIENNFNFQAGHSDDRYPFFGGVKKPNTFLDSLITQKNCGTVIIRDDWRRFSVALSADKKAEIWHVPILTISLSEGGFEKVYQGTSLVHIFDLSLKKGRPFEVTFLLYAGQSANMPNRFLNARAGIIA
ncbi:MAG: DUF1926 domain-containing protein [candidate division Zixibacteria bacterium]|nr:DUF1926 domain-containing protein [candidate division Zixibacteria bacterium]